MSYPKHIIFTNYLNGTDWLRVFKLVKRNGIYEEVAGTTNTEYNRIRFKEKFKVDIIHKLESSSFSYRCRNGKSKDNIIKPFVLITDKLYNKME